MSERELLRRHYRPAAIRLLFIGESAPASGRFFYQKDSGLYRAIRDLFASIDPSINDANFLARFQAAGCYLVDLAPEPVDDLPPAARRHALRDSIPRLTASIVDAQPAMIATLLRSIEPFVAQAIAQAAWQGPIMTLAYPGRWHRYRVAFHEQLTPVIRPLLQSAPESHHPQI